MACETAKLSARIGMLAALPQCLSAARQHIRAVLPDVSESELNEAIPLESVRRAMERLKDEYGIEMSASRKMAHQQALRLNLARELAPIRGLTSVLTREIQKRQLERILSKRRKRRRSCGGGGHMKPPHTEQELQHVCALR